MAIATTLVFLMFGAAFVSSFVEETDANVFSLFVYTQAPDIALMTAAIALGESMRSRRESAERYARLLQATLDQERAITQAVTATERTEMARELHDTLGHQTTLVTMHADVATEALPSNIATAQAALTVISETSRDMFQELRATVRSLREHEGHRPELSIAALERTVFKQSALDIEADIGLTEQLAPEVEATAYRIVQEAVTNISKHPQAGSASVRIRQDGDELEIREYDDGPPHPDAEPHGTQLGLVGMRERVAAVNGSISAGPRGTGFLVRAHLPTVLPLAAASRREPIHDYSSSH